MVLVTVSCEPALPHSEVLGSAEDSCVSPDARACHPHLPFLCSQSPCALMDVSLVAHVRISRRRYTVQDDLRRAQRSMP